MFSSNHDKQDIETPIHEFAGFSNNTIQDLDDSIDGLLDMAEEGAGVAGVLL
jgi:hypothetical protein